MERYGKTFSLSNLWSREQESVSNVEFQGQAFGLVVDTRFPHHRTWLQ